MEQQMPELVGSEKQVSWANALRVAAWPAIERYSRYLDGKLQNERHREIVANICREIHDTKKAGWWIDARNIDACEIVSRDATAKWMTAMREKSEINLHAKLILLLDRYASLFFTEEQTEGGESNGQCRQVVGNADLDTGHPRPLQR